MRGGSMPSSASPLRPWASPQASCWRADRRSRAPPHLRADARAAIIPPSSRTLRAAVAILDPRGMSFWCGLVTAAGAAAKQIGLVALETTPGKLVSLAMAVAAFLGMGSAHLQEPPR